MFLVYRFAQFFISPLLKEESVDREIQAIESGEEFINGHNVINYIKYLISKDFVKLLTIKINGKTRRFDRTAVIIK